MNEIILERTSTQQSDDEKYEALRSLGANELQARFIIAIGNGTSDGDIISITPEELEAKIGKARARQLVS